MPLLASVLLCFRASPARGERMCLCDSGSMTDSPCCGHKSDGQCASMPARVCSSTQHGSLPPAWPAQAHVSGLAHARRQRAQVCMGVGSRVSLYDGGALPASARRIVHARVRACKAHCVVGPCVRQGLPPPGLPLLLHERGAIHPTTPSQAWTA